MKKYLVLLLWVTMLFSCKRPAKSKVTYDQTCDTTSVQTVIDSTEKQLQDKHGKFLSYGGPVDFKTLTSFFDTLPYVPEDCFTNDKKYIPKEFYRLLSVPDSDSVAFFRPIQKVRLYDKYIVLYFMRVKDWDIDCCPYLYSYDTSGRFIDSLRFAPPWPATCRYVLPDNQGDFYLYGQNIAHYNCFCYNRKQKVATCGPLGMEMNYTLDNFWLDIQTGKFIKNTTFFELCKTPILKQARIQWPKSDTLPAGGEAYKPVYIDSIQLLSISDTTVQVKAWVVYDVDSLPTRWQTIQKIRLKLSPGQWTVTGAEIIDISEHNKVLKNTMKTYSNESFFYSVLSLYDITDEGFDFYLFVVPNKLDLMNVPAGEVAGRAQFISPGHALAKIGNCRLDFILKGDSVVVIKEANCVNFRHKDIRFDGVYKPDKNIYADGCYCPFDTVVCYE